MCHIASKSFIPSPAGLGMRLGLYMCMYTPLQRIREVAIYSGTRCHRLPWQPMEKGEINKLLFVSNETHSVDTAGEP